MLPLLPFFFSLFLLSFFFSRNNIVHHRDARIYRDAMIVILRKTKRLIKEVVVSEDVCVRMEQNFSTNKSYNLLGKKSVVRYLARFKFISTRS